MRSAVPKTREDCLLRRPGRVSGGGARLVVIVGAAAAGGRRCECEARNASTLGSPRSCRDRPKSQIPLYTLLRATLPDLRETVSTRSNLHRGNSSVPARPISCRSCLQSGQRYGYGLPRHHSARVRLRAREHRERDRRCEGNQISQFTFRERVASQKRSTRRFRAYQKVFMQAT